MPPPIRRFAHLLTCLAALAASPAFAASLLPSPNVIDSIEMAVADSEVIVVATLAELTIDPAAAGPKMRGALRVTEVIKGEAPARVPIVVPSFHGHDFVDWRRRGERRLVFLVPPARVAWHPKDMQYTLALRDGAPTLWENRARTAPNGGRAVGTGPPEPIAVTMDMRPLYTFDAARAAAREAAAWTEPVGDALVLRVPASSELRRSSELFEDQLVRIPVDRRAERVARQWVGDPACAEHVILVLSRFRSGENEAIIEALLDDPKTAVSGRAGKSVTWRYPIRERAAQLLQQWRGAPQHAALRGPADFYRPVYAWHLAASAACVLALPAAVFLARRLRRRRAITEPSAPALRRAPYVGLALAVVSVSLVALAVGSYRSVHEITVSTDETRYWLSSYHGGLQFVRLDQWPEPVPLSYGRFNLRDAPASLWNEAGVFPTQTAAFAGLRSVTGTMWGDDRGATYPYAGVTVPTGAVAALAALLPVAQVFVWWRNRSRRRSRIFRGCCPDCGYNLHSAGDRCPECGAPRPPPPHGYRPLAAPG